MGQGTGQAFPESEDKVYMGPGRCHMRSLKGMDVGR